MLDEFPFRIRAFHSGNGPECVNYQVAATLSDLRVEEFTNLQSRRSNDNAVIASKNASIPVRGASGDGTPSGLTRSTARCSRDC